MSTFSENTLLQKRTFGTAAVLILNIHFCRKGNLLQRRTFRPPYFFLYFANRSEKNSLKKWTFRTRSAVVLNVLFCRRVCFLLKRTFRTSLALVPNVLLCRKEIILQKRTFRPLYFLFKKGHDYESWASFDFS